MLMQRPTLSIEAFDAVPPHDLKPGFEIVSEAATVLTLAEDIRVSRHALAQDPANPRLRRRLGSCLIIADLPEKGIALLAPLAEETGDPLAYQMLAQGYLALATSAGNTAALRAAQGARDTAPDPESLAAALATLGKAQLRSGDGVAAEATLRAALSADPGNTDAYKRLVALYLDAGELTKVLALADELFGPAAGHSRLLVSRVLALARLGRIDEARAAVGFEPFFHKTALPTPPEYADSVAFNRALIADLDRNPSLRFNRHGTASRETWRIDNPLTARSGAMMALHDGIIDQVRRYIARHGDSTHPWMAARPAKAKLHSWCVMTTVAGFEEWHVHQFGWLSGVYYADVPDSVATGEGPGGCIAFGLPEAQVGSECAHAYGETLIRPASGTLMLFPSHTFHRTFPHGGDDRRVCIAFDIKPE